MSNMVSLHKLQNHLKELRPLSQFLRSAACRDASNFLRDRGMKEHQITRRITHPTHSTPSDIAVHPLVAIEYLRWVDYSYFARRMYSLGAVVDTPDEPETEPNSESDGAGATGV